MKGTSGPLRVALTRLLPVGVVAAALAVPAVATAQAPSTGSPAIDRLSSAFPPAAFARKEDQGGGRTVPNTLLPGRADSALAASNPGFAGFNGLSALDQISADDGNQASLEPPDQAL